MFRQKSQDDEADCDDDLWNKDSLWNEVLLASPSAHRNARLYWICPGPVLHLPRLRQAFLVTSSFSLVLSLSTRGHTGGKHRRDTGGLRSQITR